MINLTKNLGASSLPDGPYQMYRFIIYPDLAGGACSTPATPVVETCPVPSPQNDESDELEFFEQAATHSPTAMNVTCCKVGGDAVAVSCGQGASCVAQCRANEGTLCPSGDCDNCLSFEEQPEEEEDEEEEGGARKRCAACYGSSSLAWCPGRGCDVGRYPICCFNPICRKRSPKKCAWFSYLWGGFFSFK